MGSAGVPIGRHGDYRKWLRYYLDFCRKYRHAYAAEASLAPYLAKLESKGQRKSQCGEAEAAIRLYYAMVAQGLPTGGALSVDDVLPGRPRSIGHDVSSQDEHTAKRPKPAPAPSARGRDATGSGSWAQEYKAMGDQIQLRNYSPKTLQTYRQWVRKFQTFTQSKAPETLDTADVKAYLTELATVQRVAASTQNQAFNGLLFFYRHGLGKEFGKVDGVVRAKRRRYIPVVLSRGEVSAVIAELEPPYDLAVKLLYGCGLRISACCELRVQCFNMAEMLLTIHDGKGQKDRSVPLPMSIREELLDHLDGLRALHRQDLASATCAGVFLPRQFEKKARNAAREFAWQWFFPAPRLTKVTGADEYRRWHMQQSQLHHAIKQAAAMAQLTKRVSAHTFRHSYASHLLQAHYDIVTIQRLLGHSDVKTTMIYTQTVPSVTLKEAKSPLDLLG